MVIQHMPEQSGYLITIPVRWHPMPVGRLPYSSYFTEVQMEQTFECHFRDFASMHPLVPFQVLHS